MALRRFPNVHGVTVMMPATFAVPGEVAAFSTPRHGIFDIGRFPAAATPTTRRWRRRWRRPASPPSSSPDVMASKYGKLLMNLHNIVEAALGRGRGSQADRRAAPRRGRGGAGGGRHRLARRRRRRSAPRRADAPAAGRGVERTGGSSTQSLARGTGSIETDWLNGEIVLLGRLHGVPTPANAYFARPERAAGARGRGAGGVGARRGRGRAGGGRGCAGWRFAGKCAMIGMASDRAHGRPAPGVLAALPAGGADPRRVGGALRRLRQVLPDQARGRGRPARSPIPTSPAGCSTSAPAAAATIRCAGSW